MEHLLALLNKIQQLSPPAVFTKEIIIVQNAGMQHWLNMSLAQERGISLSIDYALPAQYLWKLVRSLADNGVDSEQNPFSREALCWRIYTILATTSVVENDKFSQVSQYWLASDSPFLKAATDSNLARESKPLTDKFSEQENLKRYQLACQLADLFEQYLVFRPDWIDRWHNHKLIELSQPCPQFTQLQDWQAILWQLLTQEQDYNPIELVNSAIANLALKPQLVPNRLSFFGLNAMPPMWLSFINKLSEYCDVHFFHLNPCFTYWGDLLTEKQAIKACTNWTEGVNDISQVVGNPLLANLGQQGREFLSLIQQYSTFDIDVFDTVKNHQHDDLTVLASVQQDILSLNDAREKALVKKDDSIFIASAHSALREVQGLHDWLLHQFNQDQSLTPKDVLVMCPQVEQYAPYVNAVFTRGWQEVDKNIPPLPCSIADRVSKDSEPLVAAFSELISLPDSRFQVSQVQAWLRIPAIKEKFSLSNDEIEQCFHWVEQACIHWGLNAEHKNQQLNSHHVSAQFTWQYGLSRLLQGFAHADQVTLMNNKVLLPNIEGDDAILLGKFMLVLEQLEFYAQSLKVKRTPTQWHDFLFQLTDDFFDSHHEDNVSHICQAIEALVEYCDHAHFQDKIALAIVQDFLNNHFSQPDPGRQFMVGQVTFCSMLPMRSVPFKVVAILGLNDGEYPRQRQPLGFDLMSVSSPRLGDRSRRGDDRYLFLEALISARQTLYLSYQGRNIKNNNERQASIVLKELMEYLTLGYGWQLSGEDKQDINQSAMQAFSERNYRGKYAGFDPKWLALSKHHKAAAAELITANSAVIIPLTKVPDDISTSSNNASNDNDKAINKSTQLTLNAAELIGFYQHPARYFARQQLDLHFDDEQMMLSDTEPFDYDHLASYLLKQSLVDCTLEQQNSAAQVNNLLSKAKLNGQFPDLPTTADILEKWRDDSDVLCNYMRSDQADKSKQWPLTVSLVVETEHHTVTVELSTTVNIVNNKLVFYRVSSAKAKDYFSLYIHQLMVQIWQQNQAISPVQKSLLSADELNRVEATQGYYFDTKNQKVTHFSYQKIHQPELLLAQLLQTFLRGQHQPLLLSGELAEKLITSKMFEQSQFEKFWHDTNRFQVFGDDPYINYFWPSCPLFASFEPLLNQIYTPVYQYKDQLA